MSTLKLFDYHCFIMLEKNYMICLLNFFLFTGIEGLCIFLRRLAYPNRLCDLENVFKRSRPALSEICTFVNMHIYRNFSHLLEDIGNLNWLNQNRLQLYANVSILLLFFLFFYLYKKQDI